MQKMRYTDQELGIIKSIFADNDEAILALRKKLHGEKLSTTHKNLTTFNPEALSVIKKTLNPQIDTNAPINQIVDLWMTVDSKDKTPEQARINFKARKLVIDYISKRLEDKKTFTLDSLIFDDKKDDETNLVNLIARNTIIAHIEQQLNQFVFLAGQKDETIDETLERLKKDSSK